MKTIKLIAFAYVIAIVALTTVGCGSQPKPTKEEQQAEKAAADNLKKEQAIKAGHPTSSLAPKATQPEAQPAPMQVAPTTASAPVPTASQPEVQPAPKQETKPSKNVVNAWWKTPAEEQPDDQSGWTSGDVKVYSRSPEILAEEIQLGSMEKISKGQTPQWVSNRKAMLTQQAMVEYAAGTPEVIGRVHTINWLAEPVDQINDDTEEVSGFRAPTIHEAATIILEHRVGAGGRKFIVDNKIANDYGIILVLRLQDHGDGKPFVAVTPVRASDIPAGVDAGDEYEKLVVCKKFKMKRNSHQLQQSLFE